MNNNTHNVKTNENNFNHYKTKSVSHFRIKGGFDILDNEISVIEWINFNLQQIYYIQIDMNIEIYQNQNEQKIENEDENEMEKNSNRVYQMKPVQMRLLRFIFKILMRLLEFEGLMRPKFDVVKFCCPFVCVVRIPHVSNSVRILTSVSSSCVLG